MAAFPGRMPFAYYNRLTRNQKRIYRASDEIESLDLPDGTTVARTAKAIARALEAEDQPTTAQLSAKFVAEICAGLNIPRAKVRVMHQRPSDDYGELHGLYEPAEGRSLAKITVWMRTAKKSNVIAFKTFLRTLLHELCHHLDYEYLELDDSFHTQGFFKRESSLFHQIIDK
jgi:hypothetical protein